MGRYDRGWIRIDRRLSLEDIAERGNNCLAIMVKLVSWANREPTTITWMGAPRKLERGQVLTGLPELAGSDRQSTVSQTRRDLDYLCKRQTIRQEVGTQGRIITLLNFDDYQPLTQVLDSQATGEATDGRQSDDSPATGNRQLNGQEDKKTKKQEDNSASAGAAPAQGAAAPDVDNSESAGDNSAPEPAHGRRVVAAYVKAWQENSPGQRPDLETPVQRRALKILLAAHPNTDDAIAVVRTYCSMKSTWYAETGYSLSNLVANLSRVRAERAARATRNAFEPDAGLPCPDACMDGRIDVDVPSKHELPEVQSFRCSSCSRGRGWKSFPAWDAAARKRIDDLWAAAAQAACRDRFGEEAHA